MSDQTNVPGTPEASANEHLDPQANATPETAPETPAEVPAEVPAKAPVAEAAPEPTPAAAPEPPAEAETPGVTTMAGTEGTVHVRAADPTKAEVGETIDLDAVQAAAAATGAASTITAEEFAKRQEEERARREEERARKAAEKEARDAAFAELEKFKTEGTSFRITVDERVKGGLRGTYGVLRIFLPASHFGVRKNVPEEELQSAVGQSFDVKVHELQSDEAGFKSAVVTRRDLLLEDFWGGIEAGAVYDGVVTSVTTFGAFVNIGGVEGLVHVSRLSRSRIDQPSDVVKKGDRLKVTVSEIDREKRKLSLSHREHEADPWEGVDAKFPAGSRVKGTVKRITDFGAYVQVAPKIEGLLRISELSWTQRVKHPSDVLSVGQEIEVEVLSTNAGKHQLALGYKQTQDNPWLNIAEAMPIGSEVSGVVQQVTPQGAVVRVNNTFDGFMPRSKMANVGRGKKIELAENQELECIVVDLDPGAASLILAMKNEDGSAVSGSDEDRGHRGGGRGGDDRRGGGRDRDHVPTQHQSAASGVTLGDLLNEAAKSKLNN